jgi:hypothetical protein
MQGCFNTLKSINVIQHINRNKDKNRLIISIDEEKALDKIQHHFMIKPLRKLGIEGMYLNIIKAVHEKLIANIILNETISPKVRNKTRVSTLPAPIQHSPGIPSYSNKARTRNKINTKRKEVVKLSQFTDDMILYLKDPKNSIPKLLDTINSLSKVAGYKINLQKSIAFVYTSSEQIKKEYRKTIPFMIASKNKSNTKE